MSTPTNPAPALPICPTCGMKANSEAAFCQPCGHDGRRDAAEFAATHVRCLNPAPENTEGEKRKRDIARTIASAIAGLLHNDEDCDPRHDCVHWPKHDAEILIFETLDAYDESGATPAAPQPETEMCALCPHEKHSGMMCLVLAAGETCQCRSERMPTEEEIADLRRRYAPQPETCVTCGHTLTGPQFCTAAGCLCSDHRGPTLSSAEEWRDVALELGAEVKRLNDQSQPETEGVTEAERIEIANLTAEINLAIYNTIPNVTLAQVERVNVRAILTAAKGGR